MSNLRRRLQLIGPYTVLILVIPVAAITAPSFFQPGNLQNITRHASFLAVVALGQLIVIIARGLDLSVGAVITTTSLLMIHLAGTASGNLGLGLVAVLGFAIAVGLLNGLMVAYRRVPAILATLATFFLVGGAALWLTEGRSRGRIPEVLAPLGTGEIGPVPIPAIITLVLALMVAWVLGRSAYGRALYATGLNPEATHLSGIPTRLVIASTFVIAALLAALAGLMLSGFVGFYDRTLGVGYDLDSIAAAVLGGASLLGGKGKVGGTVVAALGLAALDNLLLLQDVGESSQLIGKGVVLFLAVLWAALLNRPRSSPDTSNLVAPPPERNQTIA